MLSWASAENFPGGGKKNFGALSRLKKFPGGGKKSFWTSLYIRKQIIFQNLTNYYQKQLLNSQIFEIYYDFENPGGASAPPCPPPADAHECFLNI